MKPKKYLYLIQCNNSNFYKIGSAKNPEERLCQLQTGCPYPLLLVYKQYFKEAAKVEKFLHKKFRDKQKIGEWYELLNSEVKPIQRSKINMPKLPKLGIPELNPEQITLLNKIRKVDGLPPIKI